MRIKFLTTRFPVAQLSGGNNRKFLSPNVAVRRRQPGMANKTTQDRCIPATPTNKYYVRQPSFCTCPHWRNPCDFGNLSDKINLLTAILSDTNYRTRPLSTLGGLAGSSSLFEFDAISGRLSRHAHSHRRFHRHWRERDGYRAAAGRVPCTGRQNGYRLSRNSPRRTGGNRRIRRGDMGSANPLRGGDRFGSSRRNASGRTPRSRGRIPPAEGSRSGEPAVIYSGRGCERQQGGFMPQRSTSKVGQGVPKEGVVSALEAGAC